MKIFDIFLSYRRKDAEFAERLYYALKNKGRSVFWDKESLESGKFGRDIEIAINNCKNFLLIMSDDTLDRCYNDDQDWIRKEVSLAISSGKNIVPLFIGKNESFPATMPQGMESLSEYNGIPRFDINNRGKVQSLFEIFLRNTDVYSVDSDFEIVDGVLLKCLNQKLSMSVPKGIRKIADSAFYDCTIVKEVIFNPELEFIEENAFYRCNSLEYLDMPPRLKRIGKRAFYRCQHLKAINLADSLEIIDEQAFAFCSSLRSLALNKNLKRFEISAVEDCSSLETLSVNKENEYYDSSDGVIYDKEKTILLKCPPMKTGEFCVPKSVRQIGKYSFAGSHIEKLIFQDSIDCIDRYAFFYSAIREIDYPFNKNSVNVDKLAFPECANLKINPFLEKIKHRNDERRTIQSQNRFVMIKTSFEAEEEAYNMVKMLLDRKLIVSGQISDHRAVYSWNNSISDEKEIELLCFTRESLYEEVERFIADHHSYECPELLCFSINHTTVSFGNWIKEGTKESDND